MATDWGKIMIGTRLEKMVEANFFKSWSLLLTQGLRPGDRWEMTTGMVAHTASNVLVRKLLESDCDTLFILDSDAEVSSDFLEKFRSYEPGWEFDALQAWYPRRGWPPESIWFRFDGEGRLHNCLVLDQETTEEVALIGTHAVLIRKSLFQKMLGDEDPEKFEWFFYPRHEKMSEDAGFSFEAAKSGGRLGATSAVQAGHISHLALGWETYQEYLVTSGQLDQIRIQDETKDLLSKLYDMPLEEIQERVFHGSKNVRAQWEKANPQTPEEVHQFYGWEENGYLFDLAKWNQTKTYVSVLKLLERLPRGRVLIIGPGIGHEISAVREKNSLVDVFELPGVLRNVCASRFREDPLVRFFREDTLEQALRKDDISNIYDFIVAIDVLEHFTPEEFLINLNLMEKVLKPGGLLVAHNSWGDQDLYPMHTDFSEEFNSWVESSSMTPKSSISWMKSR